MPAATSTHFSRDQLIALTQRYWGYDELRPLQEQAIAAGLARRDSLVVMPTGGGKSLCYQVPPALAGRCDLVVSPLIALMKDQVDGLRACGYNAVALHSNLSPRERDDAARSIRGAGVNLIFVAPERLMTDHFLDWIGGLNIGSIAIDEAHCISHWGHDFRPEYRRLAELKQRLPGVSVHAFTATATERVQGDIIAQLGLVNPTVLVGQFDRPNLIYRVMPKMNAREQVLQIVHRHEGEAIIVYCLSRKDTEAMAAALQSGGIRAAPYHAGMDREERTGTQEAFAEERLDVICATVAFGMGIDRSNVRCVIHAAAPKSIEHYQQETGRAGRDGLEAECVLLYSYSDIARWQGLMERSAHETDDGAGVLAAQRELLNHMAGLAGGVECRHRALARYFGQPYERDNCRACDVCLGETEPMDDSTELARKILSCVARLEQRWGVGHVVDVLRGAESDAVRGRGHDQLSTFGLLDDMPQATLTNLVYQLIDQGYLARTRGDRPTVHLTGEAMPVLHGARDVRLVEPRAAKKPRAERPTESWEGVDRGLFDELRALRRELAQQQAVPAYVIFGDATLRAMARERPITTQRMLRIHGVGAKKLADYGELFCQRIEAYCHAHGRQA